MLYKYIIYIIKTSKIFFYKIKELKNNIIIIYNILYILCFTMYANDAILCLNKKMI